MINHPLSGAINDIAEKTDSISFLNNKVNPASFCYIYNVRRDKIERQNTRD